MVTTRNLKMMPHRETTGKIMWIFKDFSHTKLAIALDWTLPIAILGASLTSLIISKNGTYEFSDLLNLIIFFASIVQLVRQFFDIKLSAKGNDVTENETNIKDRNFISLFLFFVSIVLLGVLAVAL